MFLHLLEINHYREKYVVDSSLTESGICEILNCTQSHVSRLLKQNEEEGNIFRKKARIEGNKRKLCVFFLTEKGMKIGKEIQKIRIQQLKMIKLILL